MPHSISVLLVDDDEDDYFLTTECLNEIKGKKFKVTWASTYDQALHLLNEQHFDVGLFDYLLGARTGLDLLRIANDLHLQIPIILLTGRGDVTIDTEAMRLGVADYLIKSELEAEKLERSIRYGIERTATQKALRESEEKYRGVFEGSMDAICLLDAEGRFTDTNAAAITGLGYSKAELLTRKITDLFDRDDMRAIFDDRIANCENIRDFETEILTAKGERRSYIIVCTCHHLPTREDEFFFQAILHDITRRKKAEQELIIADKLAAAGHFVRMLGHEIRNPLTNIDLSVGQLLAEKPSGDFLELLEIIHRNSKRIGKLLTDLLQSSNPGQLSVMLVDPFVLLDQTLDMVADRIALKKIKVQKNYMHPAPMLIVDAEKMKIALLNILLNAVEIVAPNSGIIELTTSNAENMFIISIKDNGPGIPRELLGKIFDPYFSRKPNGLGLGLASTIRIVQSHNGTLEVNSVVGEGAEFRVLIPVVEAIN